MGAPWALFAHPLLLGQMARVRRGAVRRGRQQSADLRLLAALQAMMAAIIPADPFRVEYRVKEWEGLGWSEARFGARRFALLFRVNEEARTIVYGWIADTMRRDRLDPLRSAAEPAILLGRLCTVTVTGRICLPDALLRDMDLAPGARLVLQHEAGVLRIAAASGPAPIEAMQPAVSCAAERQARPAPLSPFRFEIQEAAPLPQR